MIINEPIKDVDYLSSKISDEDALYIKRLIFLPALYKKQDAVLFFGLAEKEDLEVNTFFNRLNPSSFR